MNIEIFVAKRLAGNNNKSANLSTPIVKIATWGVAIGIAVMLLSTSIVTGFQQEVHKKVSGFEANYTLTSLLQESDELPKIQLDNSVILNIENNSEIDFVAPFATHPGILEANSSIKGVLVKSIYPNKVSQLLKNGLLAGNLPAPESNEILISKKMVNLLQVEVGDKVKLYFVNQSLKLQPRNMKIAGIFHSGIPQLDEQLVYLPFSTLQEIKKWGVECFFRKTETTEKVSLEPLMYGGEKPYTITWFDGKTTQQKREFSTDISDTIWFAVSDNSGLLADTAFCANINGNWETWTSGGSHKYYCQGYEVFLKHSQENLGIRNHIEANAPFNLFVSSSQEDHPEIYNWLELINVNVVVILVIMTVISVINLCSALLVILLEKAQLIAVLKTLGLHNGSLKKLFLSLGALISLKGFIYGNLIAFAIIISQHYLGWLTLPEDQYFLDKVPFSFNWIIWLVINLGAIVATLFTLWFPTLIISKMKISSTLRWE